MKAPSSAQDEGGRTRGATCIYCTVPAVKTSPEEHKHSLILRITASTGSLTPYSPTRATCRALLRSPAGVDFTSLACLLALAAGSLKS